MSLNVFLQGEEVTKMSVCLECDNNHTRTYTETLFDADITHNLNRMAKQADIYTHLWRPEEIGVTLAKDLIEPLRKGLTDMEKRPEFFKKFNSPNGWGVYEDFVPWIAQYLSACIEHPEAVVNTSR